MEIILLQDIPRLGHKDQIVKVKDGYANNYLIPKGFAIRASESAKKVLEEKLRQRAHKEEKLRNEAEALKEKILAKTYKIGVKAGQNGKIFGSVTNIQLAEALEKAGFEIERKQIELPQHIKELGKYKAKVRLYKDIIAEVEFEVVAE